jgi:signal transduction histidine kinase/CheY-like chemotaxis protein
VSKRSGNGGSNARPYLSNVGKVAFLFAIYLVTAKVGLAINALNKFATILWPPSGIALAALVIFGIRLWPGIFLGALAVNYLTGAPLVVAGGIACGNTLEAVLGAFLCLRSTGFHYSLDRFRDVQRLFAGAAMFSTTVSASVGVSSLFLGGLLATDQLRETWLQWWVGDALGILTVAPLLLVFTSVGRTIGLKKINKHLVEKMALSISLIGINLLLFTNVFSSGITRNLKGPLIFPFLLWAAMRFGVTGAVLSTFVTAIIAIWATALGTGPFGGLPKGDQLLQLSIFVAIVAAMNLVISSIVTEREKERADLAESKRDAEAANAAKTAFLANMSHEIRTPLGAVLGFAELLGTEMNPSERASCIDAVKRNGKVLSSLIDDILDLSKVEAGKLEVEKVEVALDDIVRDIGSFLNLKASEKGLKTSITVAKDLPSHIETDPLRLRQILLNIVGNAIKFTEHGSVDILFQFSPGSAESPKLACLVKDTGSGIPSAQAQRVFEPFTQADISTTRRFGGTGLGLILSRKLAQALGGDVELTESTLGRGSTFTISIDPGRVRGAMLEKLPPEPPPRPTVGSKDLLKLKGLKVLLVDDNPDNQFLLCRILQSQNIRVEIARDGQEGVAKALNGDFDLILMDIQMPVMDGHEATTKLRDQGYKKPIVALTAHAMKEDRQRCLASGFSEHLSKPIDQNLLWTVLVQYSS